MLALVGLIVSAIALILDAHDTLAAWLAGAVAISAVPIGALAVLMFSYLVRGAWTNEMHVALVAASRTIPVAGLLFVPIVAGMRWLYPWIDTPPEHTSQAIYLAPWFFTLRTVAYFVIWFLLAVWAGRAWGSKEQMTRAASVGLIVYALTGSLAGIDWIESLEPNFHSSIYGLIFLTFQLLAGLSFGIAAVVYARPRSRALGGYGALLLSTLLLWAYMHAMQYIIIWAGNIPDEVEWYLRRLAGAWGFVLWGLIILQFVVPFFAMLSAHVRSRPNPLLAIAAGTLALRFVEAFVLVLPAAHAADAVLWLAIPAATLATFGILGLSLQVTLARMERSSHDRHLLPVGGSA
jgi:hypothetical protein